MHLDQLPTEICIHIFTFACTDAGTTGRALSLVSKYIRAASEPVKLQTIAIFGHERMRAFARLLAATPAHLRGTRSLFIGYDHGGDLQRYHAFWAPWEKLSQRRSWLQMMSVNEERRIQIRTLTMEMDEMRRVINQNFETYCTEGATALMSILQDVAPHLEVLCLDVDQFIVKTIAESIALPRLVHLTTRCGFPLDADHSAPPLLQPCPTLRRLHIVEYEDQWYSMRDFLEQGRGISWFAPALSHLQFSGVGESETLPGLDVALGLKTQLLPAAIYGPSPTRHIIALLPSSVEQVAIRLAGEDKTDRLLRTILDELKDPRVVLLSPEEPPVVNAGLRDWLALTALLGPI